MCVPKHKHPLYTMSMMSVVQLIVHINLSVVCFYDYEIANYHLGGICSYNFMLVCTI